MSDIFVRIEILDKSVCSCTLSSFMYDVHKSLMCMHARDGFILLVASLSLTAHQELYEVCSQTINPCSTI